MIRLWLLLGLLGTAFVSGGVVTHRYYKVKEMEAKIIFLEDQVKKKELAEQNKQKLEKEASSGEQTLNTQADKLEKGLPKNDKSDSRVVLPSTWMRDLGKLR